MSIRDGVDKILNHMENGKVTAFSVRKAGAGFIMNVEHKDFTGIELRFDDKGCERIFINGVEFTLAQLEAVVNWPSRKA